MSTAIAFDTLAYAKKLKAAGFTEAQSEVQAEAIADLVNNALVTKDYLDHRLVELESRLLIKLGLMLAAVVGILGALVAIF